MRRNRVANLVLRVLPLTLLMSACRNGHTRTLYVAPGGNNAAPGTMEEPLAGPAAALRAATAGDSIVLRAGRYDIEKPLYVSQPGLTISAAPGEIVSIHAPITNAVPNVFVVTASNVTLADLGIRGGSYYGVKIDVDEKQTPTSGVTLRGCRIGGTGRDCVKTFNADQLLIEDCEIGPSGLRDESNAEGIDSIGSHGVTIRRCKVTQTATNGIYLKGGTTDGLVESCYIADIPEAAGILLGQDTDPEFMRDGARYEAIRCIARNNIVVNTGGSGIGTYSGDSIQFVNNTLYQVARESGAGVWVGVNRRSVAARNITIRNNIVLTGGPRPYVFLLHTDGVPEADNNIFFGTVLPGRFQIEGAGQVTNLTMAEWRKTTGQDAHSKIADPRLDAANSYRPLPGSPALQGGVSLPEVPADFNGAPRPLLGASDVGAQQVSLEPVASSGRIAERNRN